MSHGPPSLFFFVVFAATGALLGSALRVGLPTWWRVRAVRGAATASLAGTALALLVWLTAALAHAAALAAAAQAVFRAAMVFVLPLALVLPLSALTLAAGRLWARRRGVEVVRSPEPALPPPPTAPRGAIPRRALLNAAAASLPVGSLMASATGLVSASLAPRVTSVPLGLPGLAPELVGLRVLHLSDLHLGAYAHVADLERALARFAGAAPDVVVLTGDVADDLRQLPPALALVAALRPRLGAFAALGNHEHFHGVKRARDAYERSEVELLVDRGTTRDLGGARVHVLGVDDPFPRRGDVRVPLRASLDRALDGGPSDAALRLLLSHRPRGFDAAADVGIDVTLSGHTHGAQLGTGERSVFEGVFPEQYLWGVYARGRSRLYTTSGFGHWFPFRLGCPAELAVIELRPQPAGNVGRAAT